MTDEYGVVSGPRGDRRIVGRHDDLVEAMRHVNLLYDTLDVLWARGIEEWMTERRTDNHTNWDRQIARRWARLGSLRQGVDRLVVARLGPVGFGTARRGRVGHGSQWQGRDGRL